MKRQQQELFVVQFVDRLSYEAQLHNHAAHYQNRQFYEECQRCQEYLASEVLFVMAEGYHMTVNPPSKWRIIRRQR